MAKRRKKAKKKKKAKKAKKKEEDSLVFFFLVNYASHGDCVRSVFFYTGLSEIGSSSLTSSGFGLTTSVLAT